MPAPECRRRSRRRRSRQPPGVGGGVDDGGVDEGVAASPRVLEAESTKAESPAPECRRRSRRRRGRQPPSIRSTLRRCRCRRAVDEDVQRRRRPESPVRRVRVVEVDARGRIGVDHGAGRDGSSVRWQASNLMGADQIALAPRHCLVHVVV